MTKAAQPLLPAKLMLVTPPVSDAAAFAPLLGRALASGAISAVLLRLSPTDERKQVNLIKELVPVVQTAGAALVAETTPAIAIRGGADGAHVAMRQPEDIVLIGEAREQLTQDRILGAGGLKSRHDAMEAGEIGVDYVMFGEPRADASIMTLDTVIERASWWAGIFQTPGIAYAPDADAVTPLAATGIEFVALGAWIFADGTDTAKAITGAQDAIAACVNAATA